MELWAGLVIGGGLFSTGHASDFSDVQSRGEMDGVPGGSVHRKQLQRPARTSGSCWRSSPR